MRSVHIYKHNGQWTVVIICDGLVTSNDCPSFKVALDVALAAAKQLKEV